MKNRTMKFLSPWIVTLLLSSVGLILCAVAAPETDKTLSDHNKLMAKMDALIFKKVELKNAPIEEIVQLLTQESKKLDPEHQGLHFIIQGKPVLPPVKITLNLTNASLKETLKEIQQQSNFAYTVGDSVIYIWHDSGEGLTHRVFTVPRGFFQGNSEQVYDVTLQLEAKGIHFPSGQSAQYQPKERKLTVTAGSAQVEDIDYLLFKELAISK